MEHAEEFQRRLLSRDRDRIGDDIGVGAPRRLHRALGKASLRAAVEAAEADQQVEMRSMQRMKSFRGAVQSDGEPKALGIDRLNALQPEQIQLTVGRPAPLQRMNSIRPGAISQPMHIQMPRPAPPAPLQRMPSMRAPTYPPSSHIAPPRPDYFPRPAMQRMPSLRPPVPYPMQRMQSMRPMPRGNLQRSSTAESAGYGQPDFGYDDGSVQPHRVASNPYYQRNALFPRPNQMMY